MSFVMVLILFLLLTAAFGAVTHARSTPSFYAWAPFGSFLLYTLVLLLTGHLHG